MVLVARVFRRGDVSSIGKRTLASREASYNFPLPRQKAMSTEPAGLSHFAWDELSLGRRNSGAKILSPVADRNLGGYFWGSYGKCRGKIEPAQPSIPKGSSVRPPRRLSIRTPLANAKCCNFSAFPTTALVKIAHPWKKIPPAISYGH